MKRLLIAAIALLCAVAMSVQSADAESYPSLSEAASVADTGIDDVAILVAVEDYLLLPDVPGALANANDWESFLRNGLGVRDVRTLSNAQATREDVLSVVKSAAKAAPAGAKIWFIFIGHGAPASDGSDGMLVGMDAKGTPRSLDARGIGRTELIDLIQQSDAEPVLVFDACFSGRDAGGNSLAPGVQPVLSPAALAAVRQSVVFSAAASDQFAGDLPGAGRPAFSYLLLGALRGWGDLDDDGNVTAAEAHEWVSQQLTAITVREQTPELVGTQDVVLTWKVTERAPPISNIIARNLETPVTTSDSSEEPLQPLTDAPRASAGCGGGKVPDATTGEHCCWPGQAWSGEQCVGAPNSCPAGFEVVGDLCEQVACSGGLERAADGIHCCWPGQGWSREEDRCIGEPTQCPAGTEAFSTPLSLAGDGCFPPQQVEVVTRQPDVRVYANGYYLGSTNAEGRLLATVPDERYVLSAEKDGTVLRQKRCFEGGPCSLDATRTRYVGVFLNAAGILLPFSSLMTVKFAIRRFSLELGADVGAVNTDFFNAWYGASLGAAWSTGADAWNGPLIGVRGGYLVSDNTTIGGGGTTPWLSVGPVVGFRKQFSSGVTVEAHVGARVVGNLDDGQVGGPAIDAALAIGYVF